MRLSDEEYQEIINRVNAGLITMRNHPVLDYHIFNYTSRTQYDNRWDSYTKMCRGLILDSDHTVIAKPFPKFFGLNDSPETTLINLPHEMPLITEKLDGVLAILFPDGDTPTIATRGMFNSDQALWATNWLRSKGYSMDDFYPNYTYCLEIISPKNRVVVDYKERAELVLLAVINNDNGTELDHVQEAIELGLSYANEYRFDDIFAAVEYLTHTDGISQEGFVCKYSSGLRLKLKSEEYKRLHKIIFGFTAKDVWNALRLNKTFDDILNVVPDESYQSIKKTEAELCGSFEDIMAAANIIVSGARELSTRKEQSLYILSHTENQTGVRSVAFELLDNHIDNAKKLVWKLIEPKIPP